MVVTFIYCCYYIAVRPFNYLIQNIVVILNECFIFAVAGLFCGFLSGGSPDENLALAIIILFSIDIIGCFMLGFGFQIYLIYLKYRKNKTGSIAPVTKNTTQNYTENQVNVRNDTQLQLKEQNYEDPDEEDAPAKDTHRGDLNKDIQFQVNNNYSDAVKAGNIKEYSEGNSKESSQNLTPNIHFLKNRVEESRDSENLRIDVLGGNL
jgi:hypothetical protein